MAMQVLSFLAIVLTGLALVAPGAHLLELPNKIVLAESQYFTVQGIYRGWWLVDLHCRLHLSPIWLWPSWSGMLIA